MGRRLRSTLGLGLALLSIVACDRRIEPFDPNEQPKQPDLSRIFPAGAENPMVDPNAPLELPPPPMREAAEAAGESGAPIRGTLRLAPELAGKTPAGAVLFLIARTQPAGPPLAVKRIESPRFPLDFEIGPADRMMKSMPFVGPVQLSARLDSDGNAMSRTPGDIQGNAAQVVEPGATGVEIVLNAPIEESSGPMREAAAPAGDGGAPIRGTLRLAPELAGRTPAGAVLFLIARTQPAGPPLAVKRIESPRFPLDFEIGPADRMMKSMPFVGPVQLSARLDSDGNAMSRTPGDIQGSAAQAVEPGATGVEIVLGERL